MNQVCLQIVKKNCSLLPVADAIEGETPFSMTASPDCLLQFRRSEALPCEGLVLHESIGKPLRRHHEGADRACMKAHPAVVQLREGYALHCGRISRACATPRGRKELHRVHEGLPADADLRCNGSSAGFSIFSLEECGGLAAAILKFAINEVRCTFGNPHGSMQHIANSFRPNAENAS